MSDSREGGSLDADVGAKALGFLIQLQLGFLNIVSVHLLMPVESDCCLHRNQTI